MSVSVVVPWRPGCPWRERAWAWVRTRYELEHPDWEIVTGDCDDGPYNRAQAILDGARRASGDTLVVADADVWCDPAHAIGAANLRGWAIPHRLVHRLSPASTELVFAGHDWRGLPLSTDNPQDSKPYTGHETGTLVVIRRDVLEQVPPDIRFVGWGSEDDAWALALRTIVGRAVRGDDDLMHLWHPPQPRETRIVGTRENADLLRRYRRANGDRAAMTALIGESTQIVTHSG